MTVENFDGSLHLWTKGFVFRLAISHGSRESMTLFRRQKNDTVDQDAQSGADLSKTENNHSSKDQSRAVDIRQKFDGRALMNTLVAKSKEEMVEAQNNLKKAVGLGPQPDVIPDGAPDINGEHRVIELGWHPASKP